MWDRPESAVRTGRPRAPSTGRHLLYTSSRAVQDTIPASFLADTVYQPASSFVAPWMSRHTSPWWSWCMLWERACCEGCRAPQQGCEPWLTAPRVSRSAAATPAGGHGVGTCRLCPVTPSRQVTSPCLRHRGAPTTSPQVGLGGPHGPCTLGWPASPILREAPHRGEPCCLRTPRPEGGQGPALTSRGPCCESVTRSPSSRISVVGVPPRPGTPTSQGSRPPRPCSAASPERPAACALP